MEAVHRYEGTVNQVMGDGIMALFGAPLAHEDHAVRACYAALRMQEAVKQYAEEVRRDAGRADPDPRRAELRRGGRPLDRQRPAHGLHGRRPDDAPGRPDGAARRARARSCSRRTRSRLAEGYVQVKALGPVPVKGLSEPVEVYELLGARHGALAAPGRRGARADRVRRARRRAGDAAPHAASRRAPGHGQVVALVGEPGVGKSRLVWEFTHSHRTAGLAGAGERLGLLRQGDALPAGDRPAQELLRRSRTATTPRAIREKVTGKLLDARPSAASRRCPPLLALLDVPVEDAACGRRSIRRSGASGRSTPSSACCCARARSSRCCWCSRTCTGSTPRPRRCSTAWWRACRPRASSLLVNYRPEYEHGWRRQDLLPAAAARPAAAGERRASCCDALLGTNGGLAPLKRLLIERTEGNPFFLEESVRTLVETGVLAGERGAYRLAKAVLESTQVPATVQAVLAARIDRLRPRTSACSRRPR